MEQAEKMEQAEAGNSILNEYMTKGELAAQLHRSIRSVDRWALTGDGPPCIRIGRRSLYRRAAVLAWLRGLEITPGRVGREQRGGPKGTP
jgi:hypothetical protein